jgi:hypothetical protein
MIGQCEISCAQLHLDEGCDSKKTTSSSLAYFWPANKMHHSEFWVRRWLSRSRDVRFLENSQSHTCEISCAQLHLDEGCDSKKTTSSSLAYFWPANKMHHSEFHFKAWIKSYFLDALVFLFCTFYRLQVNHSILTFERWELRRPLLKVDRSSISAVRSPCFGLECAEVESDHPPLPPIFVEVTKTNFRNFDFRAALSTYESLAEAVENWLHR